MACSVSADGKRAISVSSDRMLKVWNLESRRELFTLSGHSSWVRACGMSADGKRAVSGSEDNTLKVWDLESGHELFTLSGHSSSVMGCGLSADGKRAISGSEDKTLKVWDLESGTCQATVYGMGAFLSLSLCGSLLVAGDAAGNVWMLQLAEPFSISSTSMPPRS